MYKAIMICSSLFILTGCWDRQEINDVAFVSGSAIDKKDDQYQVTIQIPLPGQMGGAGSEGGGGGTSGGKTWYNETQVADNIREANSMEQERSSRKIYFAHRRIVVFGEELARDGIGNILDVFVRVPQNRLTAYVVIAKGKGADILSTQVPIEQNPSEMVRELANFEMKNPRSLKDVVHLLLSDGIDPALPVAAVKKLPLEKGKVNKTVEMDGLAVFRDDKLVGILEGDSASGVTWAMNEVENPELIVTPPHGKGEINIRFPQTRTKVVPTIKGDHISFDIYVRAKGGVVDNESNYDTSVKHNLVDLEQEAEKKLKEQIEQGVEQLQKEYLSDPIGFGHHILLKYPEKWKEIRRRWEGIYPTVQVKVHTVIHIEQTGSLNEPVGIKEKNQVND